MNKTNPFVRSGLIGLAIFCALHVLAAILEEIAKGLYRFSNFINYETRETLFYAAEWLEDSFGDEWIPVLTLVSIIATSLGFVVSRHR